MEEISITLKNDVLEKINRYVEDLYPEEACGVLLTDDKEGAYGQLRITDAYSIENTAQSDSISGYFSIDPIALFAVEKRASENGLTVTGFYHSHPDKEAVPSAEDEKNMVPGQIYIIASVSKGILKRIKGYMKKYPDADICEVKLFSRFA